MRPAGRLAPDLDVPLPAATEALLVLEGAILGAVPLRAAAVTGGSESGNDRGRGLADRGGRWGPGGRFDDVDLVGGAAASTMLSKVGFLTL